MNSNDAHRIAKAAYLEGFKNALFLANLSKKESDRCLECAESNYYDSAVCTFIDDEDEVEVSAV
jgi:hypothetical protein